MKGCHKIINVFTLFQHFQVYCKIAAKGGGKVRQFKPQICQNRGRGENRQYSQRNYQNRYRSDNRSNNRDRGQFKQDRGETDFSKAMGETIGKIQEIMEDKTVEESIRITLIEMTITIEVGIGLEKSHLPWTYGSNRARSTNNSRLRSGSRVSTNRGRIRCYKWREYDHFTKDCPTSREQEEIEQLQQMPNLEEKQTSLSTYPQNSSVENPRVSPLNL